MLSIRKCLYNNNNNNNNDDENDTNTHNHLSVNRQSEGYFTGQ